MSAVIDPQPPGATGNPCNDSQARKLGLDFVSVADHNVRGMEEWSYPTGGPLIVVGEEVSTPCGHILVVGRESMGNREREADLSLRKPVVAPEEDLRIAAHPLGRRA